MQPKQLQYFITAYATKNIQRTAEKLFVSRQGISKTIRELEQELGADLFLRSSKGLEPTDFAEALFPHAKKLLDEYNYITGLNTLAKQKENVITIYALDNIVKYLTAEFFFDFRYRRPLVFVYIVRKILENAVFIQRVSHQMRHVVRLRKFINFNQKPRGNFRQNNFFFLPANLVFYAIYHRFRYVFHCHRLISEI